MSHVETVGQFLVYIPISGNETILIYVLSCILGQGNDEMIMFTAAFALSIGWLSAIAERAPRPNESEQ